VGIRWLWQGIDAGEHDLELGRLHRAIQSLELSKPGNRVVRRERQTPPVSGLRFDAVG
jgi:hypothetical protein